MDENNYRQSPFKFSHDLYSMNLYSYKWTIPKRAYRKISTLLFNKLLKKVPEEISDFGRTYDLELLYFLNFLRARIDNSFTHIVGVEAQGISIASEVSGEKRLIYYNMELLQRKSCPDAKWEGIKSAETKSLSKVDTVVIQNDKRAAVFASENVFDTGRIKVLPIFPIGECIIDRTDFFRKKFNISDNKYIILYAGNFHPWAMCLEIIKTVPNWGKEFVLIMHTWNKSATLTPYYRDMVRLAENLPVYFSTDAVGHDELPHALASADIGLLFYRPLDENFTEIAGSSNKLAEYLRACLPVVTFSGSSLGDLIDTHKIGISVDSIEMLPNALQTIRNNYEIFRDSCVHCYYKHFSFEKHFADIYEDVFC
jgi:glycosyltransferase involved in cell wall biosynthesis